LCTAKGGLLSFPRTGCALLRFEEINTKSLAPRPVPHSFDSQSLSRSQFKSPKSVYLCGNWTMFRFGQDGLAMLSSYQDYSVNNLVTTVMLIRGPFVAAISAPAQ